MYESKHLSLTPRQYRTSFSTKLNLIKKYSKRVTWSATTKRNILVALIYEKCAKSGEFLFWVAGVVTVKKVFEFLKYLHLFEYKNRERVCRMKFHFPPHSIRMFYKCDFGIKIYMRRQPHFQPPPGFSLINKDKRFYTLWARVEFPSRWILHFLPRNKKV